MKKLILSLSLVLGGCLTAFSQLGESMYGDQVKFDVKMKYVYTFEEALKKAREEDRLIFFNCFADWAVPCHSMNNKVFSNQKFADWMDRHFVNFITDVTKPAGKPLADRYGIRYQAHYLVLDKDGNVVHRIVGGCGLPEFQEKLALALNPKTSLAGTDKRYAAGERSRKFLHLYANVLKMADQDRKYDTITTLYFSKISQKDWCRKENWEFFKDQSRKYESDMFRYLLDHRDDFFRENGKAAVVDHIVEVYARPVYFMAAGQKEYDGVLLLDIYTTLQSLEVPENNSIYSTYWIAKYRGEGNFDKMMDVVERDVPRMDSRLASGLNLSLREMADPERAPRLGAYFTKAAGKAQGRLKKELEFMARQLLNPEGIQFEKSTFAEALAKAKAEGRLLFLDCYTSWCGPCKMMSREIFTQKMVGDFFNGRFVSLKLDMEKGEGKDIMKKYPVSAFPTMLLIDGEGRVVYKMVGGADAETFLKKVERGLDPDNCYYRLKERYAAGERSADVMGAYFVTMQDAMELKEVEGMARIYLEGLKGGERFGRGAWKIYDALFNDYSSPEFQFICRHRKDFAQLNGSGAVDGKIERTIISVLLSYFKGQTVMPDVRILKELVGLSGFPEASTAGSLARILELHAAGNRDLLLDYYETKVAALKDENLKINLNFLLEKMLDKATDAQWARMIRIMQKSAETASPEFRTEYEKGLKMLRQH